MIRAHRGPIIPQASMVIDGKLVVDTTVEDLVLGNVKYTGHTLHGKPHGHGISVVIRDGHFKGDRYTGEHRHGLRAGHGAYEWRNHNKFIGEWVNDKKQGRGALRFHIGKRIFDGEWRMDRPLTGTALDTDGSIYLVVFRGKRYFEADQWKPSDSN